MLGYLRKRRKNILQKMTEVKKEKEQRGRINTEKYLEIK